MITKQQDGFIGYGETDKESNDSMVINALMMNITNMAKFDGLTKRRKALSPWHPKRGTLHIRGANYISYNDGVIKVGNKLVSKSDSLFQMLYLCFFNLLELSNLLLCSPELKEFFEVNEIHRFDLSKYSQVMFEEVDFESDTDISCYVLTNEYSVVLYKSNKVALKRNDEQWYWSYTNSNGSTLDSLYYIAYLRGYENFDNFMKGELQWQNS